jgi:hypothetical protein
MNPQAPRVLYILGGGRSSTREARRLDRFGSRVERIGDLVIRPQRRVAVTVEFAAQHLAELQDAISRGSIVVQHDADTFVDPQELQALVAGKPSPTSELPTPLPPKLEPVAEPVPEPVPEPVEPAPEPVPELVEPTPEPEPEVEEVTLPYGWERSNKRELMMLCSKCGVEVSETDTNRGIVAKLKAWEQAH